MVFFAQCETRKGLDKFEFPMINFGGNRNLSNISSETFFFDSRLQQKFNRPG
jgi:hypothetical protein